MYKTNKLFPIFIVVLSIFQPSIYYNYVLVSLNCKEYYFIYTHVLPGVGGGGGRSKVVASHF